MLYHLNDIRAAVSDTGELIEEIEHAYVSYSTQKAQIPPVGYLEFPEANGSTHIKYGHIDGDDVFVIKVASGFYNNAEKGLPSGSGAVLVFSAETGFLQAVLADDGYLTDRRTAVAGAICARHFAPKEVPVIGILGTGMQARLQLTVLREILPTRNVMVWGRNETHTAQYRDEMEDLGYRVKLAKTPGEVAEHCNYIVTATPSSGALLYGSDIRKGTHITAVGCDSPGKQELDASVFARADLVVADSVSQCVDHGDISHAIQEGVLREETIQELGKILEQGINRSDDRQITVTDLTGVAVQDIAIAKVALHNLQSRGI